MAKPNESEHSEDYAPDQDDPQDVGRTEGFGTDDTDTAAIEAELDALRAERAELKDRLLRAMAEAENARKRGERDRREAEAYGGTRLARDLLPVYDNLRRALDAAGDGNGNDHAAQAVIEGVELTLRELVNVFSRHGIERISPQIGDPFDPQRHQAMFEAPVPSVPAGNLIQVMTEGFTIHERLLRPAQVGVSSARAVDGDAKHATVQSGGSPAQ